MKIIRLMSQAMRAINPNYSETSGKFMELKAQLGTFRDSLIGDHPQIENYKPLISELLRISESPVRADRSVSSSEYDSCSGELK